VSQLAVSHRPQLQEPMPMWGYHLELRSDKFTDIECSIQWSDHHIQDPLGIILVDTASSRFIQQRRLDLCSRHYHQLLLLLVNISVPCTTTCAASTSFSYSFYGTPKTPTPSLPCCQLCFRYTHSLSDKL